MSIASITVSRLALGFLVSSFTISIWDFIESLPEDVRLLKEHLIRLPTITYLTTRTSTLALFSLMISMASTLEHARPTRGLLYLSPVPHHAPQASPIGFYVLFVLQRGATSLLFYLRVHALYRSNRYIQLFFVLLLIGVMVTPVVFFGFSGVACAVFDLCIFFAILWKIVWHRKGDQRGETNASRTFWNPFEPSQVHQISERFLRDSLLYVFIAILVKIPQIAFMAQVGQEKPVPLWTLYTTYTDIAISGITSSKIFRDMKLGLPGLSERPINFLVTTTPSKLEFATPQGIDSEIE